MSRDEVMKELTPAEIDRAIAALLRDTKPEVIVAMPGVREAIMRHAAMEVEIYARYILKGDEPPKI